MSELGDPFAGDQSVSASKLDSKVFAVCNGTKIAAFSSSQAIAAAIPTTTAGGFTQNIPVYRKVDGSGWLSFFPKHVHAQDLDSDGGTYYAIRKANSGMIIITMESDTRNSFYNEVSGTGATIDDNISTGNTAMRVRTGVVANNYASIFLSSLRISFASPIFAEWKLTEGVGTSILTRIGIGIEKVQNSVDNTQKIGIEGCDSDGTDFMLLEADGVGRSKIDGLGLIATTLKPYKLTFTPGGSTVLNIGNGGTTATITSNVPNSGSIAAGSENQLFRAGVKTTNTTEKTINLYALQIYGTADSSDWF